MTTPVLAVCITLLAIPTILHAQAAPIAHDSARSTSDSSARSDSVGRPTDAIGEATEAYRRTGIARTLREGELVTVPYGHSQPTLTCAPLRVCTIELDSGEVVLDRLAGDTQRWEIAQARAGAYGQTPLVAIKPHDCGISSNLLLTTSTATGHGRIYEITLDSPPCTRGTLNPIEPYIRHIRYYYPDDLVASLAHPTAVQPTANTIAVGASFPLERLNFDYHVIRGKHFPWSPTVVFDDGTHVYIRLPEKALRDAAPVLFGLSEDGTKTLLNYTIAAGTYVTDRPFRRGVFVLGEGGDVLTLEIDNRAAAESSDRE